MLKPTPLTLNFPNLRAPPSHRGRPDQGHKDVANGGNSMSASYALSTVQVTGSNLNITYVVLAVALGALAIAYALRQQVLAASEGTAKMREIAEAVQEGAAAYLARQFRTLSYFVGIVFFLLLALPADTTSLRIGRSIFFLLGAGFSALVGYNGMWLAVRANVRVAEAARQKDGAKAVQIAFRTGGVVGMTTVGLGLVGASLVVILFRENAPVVLEGFGFGAAMLAMFMRVGGGIFTKAADVGADLVGKVEKVFQKMTHEIQQQLQITSAITSVTALVWLQISLSPMQSHSLQH